MPHDLTVLTYRCLDAKLEPLVRQAAATWNDVMRDLVQLRPVTGTENAYISIGFDSKSQVRDAENLNRVAFCHRVGPDRWDIRLSSDIRWAFSAWGRFFTRGENALAAIVHEIGHVFTLPHSNDPQHVMHPEIGGSGKLARREKEHYRAKFLQILESEA